MQTDLPPSAQNAGTATKPVRRNRDRAARHTGTAPTKPKQLEPGLAVTDSPTLQDVLARGHWWLRFPEPWEARFQKDCAPARRKLITWCAVIGIIAYWLVAANDVFAVPDMAKELANVRTGLTSLMITCLVTVVAIPERHKRNWHYELATSFNTVVLSFAIVWIAMTSTHLTATAHTAAVTTVVMYTAIAARQRFWWALSTAVIAVGSYVAFARGFSPTQALLLESNVNLALLATLCTLGANYTLEYLERRLWILGQLSDAHRQALGITRQTLDELSKKDSLTGLYNRRQFDAEMMRAWQTPQPVSLVLLDVDHFKAYNDTYGHLAGDTCLQDVAKVLSAVARSTGGVAARIGGEEFAVLLSGQTADAARRTAEQICEKVRDAKIEHKTSATAPHVTVSAGVASTISGEGSTPDALYKCADQGLYAAKASGRNQVGILEQDSHRLAESTQGASGSAPAVVPPAPADLPSATSDLDQDLLRETLAKPRLKFAPPLEERYQEAGARRQRWVLTTSSAAGLIVLNGFLYISRPMFQDVWNTMWTAQALVAAIVLFSTAMVCIVQIRPWIRDLVYALGAAAVALTTAAVLAQSGEVTALGQAKCLVLIPLFACVAGRLPFRFACIPALVTIASLGQFRPEGQEATLILQLSSALVISGTLYALIAAYTLERDARRAWLTNRLGRLQSKALEAATQRLRSLSTLDPLTGISNRRHFEQRLAQLWERTKARRQPMSMLILDVDYFKLYNDGYGHAAGDQCLKQIALILQGVATHEGVMVARLGGEEFAILLEGKTLGEALKMAESVCAAVRNACMEHRFSRVGSHVTVSVGASCSLPWEAQDSRALIGRADDALYQAKTEGRDRACGLAVPN